LAGRPYAQTYARVMKFYSDKIGYDFVNDPKKMDIRKGETKKGQFIFCDVRGPQTRESSFVFNSAEYSVTAFIRPADAKDTVEVTVSIAVR
jgi:hypothetical protein